METLTNEEKLEIYFLGTLSTRISIGLLYSEEDFKTYERKLDTRNFQERLDYYYPMKHDPQKNMKELREEQFNKVLEEISYWVINVEIMRIYNLWTNDESLKEQRKLFGVSVTAYFDSIATRLEDKSLVRWPHITYNFEKKTIDVIPEVMDWDHAKCFIESEDDGRTSEIDYDEEIVFKPNIFERSRRKRKINLEKHVDVSFLDESVNEDISGLVRSQIKERLCQGSKNSSLSTHHMVSFGRLSFLGYHHDVLQCELLNNMPKHKKILARRLRDNAKFLQKGCLVACSHSENRLPVDQLYLQVMVDSFIQAAGNLFFGPDPELRKSKNRGNFDAEAKVIWTPEEYESLSKLDSSLLEFLNRYNYTAVVGKMEAAKQKKCKNEDLTAKEKLDIIQENVNKLVRCKTNKEIKETYGHFVNMVNLTKLCFIKIAYRRRLQNFEPLPFYPTMWKLSSSDSLDSLDQWEMMTIDEIHWNVKENKLPEWLQKIITDVERSKETKIGLKFEFLPFGLEPKFPRYSGINKTLSNSQKISLWTGSIEVNPSYEIRLADLASMILDRDFDSVAKLFHLQTSTSSAIADIHDFVMEVLRRRAYVHKEIWESAKAVLAEIERRNS